MDLPTTHRARTLSSERSCTLDTAASATERPWGRATRAALRRAASSRRCPGCTAEAGYGMALFGNCCTETPNVSFGMSDGGAHEYRMGWRLTTAVRGDPL